MRRSATIACAAEADAEVNAGAELPVVLVVEDDVLIRLGVAEYLREHAITVIEAANAAEAMAVFEAGEPVRVVFSDVNLAAGMDGFALARWVEARCPGVGILLTSGIARPETGGAAFVEKPYDPATVEREIRRLLDRRGA
jgi:DNA-binding NtrC family response regulator